MNRGLVNVKHVVISSYSDLSKLSSKIKLIHFRKFVSKKLLKIILNKCPRLERISLSRYAYKRFNSNLLKSKNIEIRISKNVGRPNLVEVIL